jgi:TRAP-type C4-dicarboxylate transport system permease small subunit
MKSPLSKNFLELRRAHHDRDRRHRAVVLMMLMVVYDITGRSLGLWHVLSTVEQTTLYMMLLGFFGLGALLSRQGNIVVDVATHSLPARPCPAH